MYVRVSPPPPPPPPPPSAFPTSLVPAAIATDYSPWRHEAEGSVSGPDHGLIRLFWKLEFVKPCNDVAHIFVARDKLFFAEEDADVGGGHESSIFHFHRHLDFVIVVGIPWRRENGYEALNTELYNCFVPTEEQSSTDMVASPCIVKSYPS